MSVNRKISVKKVKRFAIGSVLLLAFFTILIAAAHKQSESKIKGIQVTLKNDNNEENFLLAKDVEQLFVKNQQIDIAEKDIATLDLNQIEKIAESNAWVKNAEVFIDNTNTLNIEVMQRLPVARVFTKDAKSFYIDTAGFEMPLSSRYAYPVTVFTGYVRPENDSMNSALKKRLVYISQVLTADSFWNNQVAQVDLTPAGNFILIPTIGKQKILFGDTSNAAVKLHNLYSFYREVSNKIGWDKYETLDVRFKGQVVASPSLGWIPPKDSLVAMRISKDTMQNNEVDNAALPSHTQPVVVAAPKPKIIPKHTASINTVKDKPKSKVQPKVAPKTTDTKKSQTKIASKEKIKQKKTPDDKPKQQPKYIFNKK